MKIAAIRERAPYENRCAISPEVTKLLVKKGLVVFVEKDIGTKAGFPDAAYSEAGAKVSNIPLEILADADIILKVQPSPLSNPLNELELAKEGAIIIGMLSPYLNKEYVAKLLDKKLSSLAMELVPRISKAQNMDVLSSQSNLAGYRAVIEASYHFERAFPMMMTAAGTITPAKTLVLGVGVAGLQAIATAKRLGAAVFAYDVRSDTKEQVQSLGAKFISPQENNDKQARSGSATVSLSDEQKKQEEFLSDIIKNYDIVITTAQIPGRRAPILVTAQMIKSMKPGSIIVDMSTATGGNVESSIKDEIIVNSGVKIIGWSNLASFITADASKLYAKNLYNFIDYALEDGKFNFANDLVSQMLLTQNGKIIQEKFKGLV